LHPLKVISLSSWIGLLAFQLSLLLPGSGVNTYWVGLLVLALLIPGKGLCCSRRYTYKWIGFLTMVYFCIGISELVSNPALKVYGFGTTITSMSMFLASIYFARFLGRQSAGP